MTNAVRFPVPTASSDLKEWALQITQVLQRFLGQIPSEDQVGSIVIWAEGAKPPESVIPCGGSFSAKSYPVLARQLGTTTVPTIPAPAGFTLGVIAR